MIFPKKTIYLLYALLALVYVSGLFIPLMENDSAQHATMAMRMYLRDDFVHLFKGYNEYLDKPHMHFWLSALSFKLFGLSHWAYRIPALLMTALGAYSCYHLAKHLYGKETAHPASLIFLSSQAIILANHDVRTDAVLTGAVIFAIWQWVKYLDTTLLKHAILGGLATAIAFSTKGLLAIVFIGSGLLCYVLYARKWKSVFNWKLLVGIVAFLVACTPMLYAYYMQFDMYPDKVVNGQTNVSGIKFIFWDQSFNRLTGDGFGANNKDYFFFFHTLLWASLPWALLIYVAIFSRIKQFFDVKFKYQKHLEFLTLGGFWLVMFIINTSKSKLPHYMNSMFPILAILLAGYLAYLYKNSNEKVLKRLLYTQYFVVIVGSILLAVLTVWVFPPKSIVLIVSFIGFLALLIYFLRKKDAFFNKIVIISVVFASFLNFVLNTNFYPSLLNYQGGSNMAKIITKEHIPVEDIYILDENQSWSLNFYTQRETPNILTPDLNKNSGKWLFLHQENYNKLKENGTVFSKEFSVPHYRITRLKGTFLNPKTREETLSKMYLVKLG